MSSRDPRFDQSFWWPVALIAYLIFLPACTRQDMHDQPKYKPLTRSTFFEDTRSSRSLVPGTVPRGYLNEDLHLYTGRASRGAGSTQPMRAQLKSDAKLAASARTPNYVDTFPFAVTREILERGRERFDIFCAVCHGRVGNGDGMVVRRGFRQPPSYHIDRLREAPAGHFFDVITNGFGAMPDYAAQIPVRDRWAIVAYLRALQLSQHAAISDVPPEGREKLGITGERR